MTRVQNKIRNFRTRNNVQLTTTPTESGFVLTWHNTIWFCADAGPNYLVLGRHGQVCHSLQPGQHAMAKVVDVTYYLAKTTYLGTKTAANIVEGTGSRIWQQLKNYKYALFRYTKS